MLATLRAIGTASGKPKKQYSSAHFTEASESSGTTVLFLNGPRSCESSPGKTYKKLPQLKKLKKKATRFYVSASGKYIAGCLRTGDVVLWRRGDPAPTHIEGPPTLQRFHLRHTPKPTKEFTAELEKLYISDDGSVLFAFTIDRELYFRSLRFCAGTGGEWVMIPPDVLRLKKTDTVGSIAVEAFSNMERGEAVAMAHVVLQLTAAVTSHPRSSDSREPELKKDSMRAMSLVVTTANLLGMHPNLEDSGAIASPNYYGDLTASGRTTTQGGSWMTESRTVVIDLKLCTQCFFDAPFQLSEEEQVLLSWDPLGSLLAIAVNTQFQLGLLFYSNTQHCAYGINLAQVFSSQPDGLLSRTCHISSLTWTRDGLFLIAITFGGQLMVCTRNGSLVNLRFECPPNIVAPTTPTTPSASPVISAAPSPGSPMLGCSLDAISAESTSGPSVVVWLGQLGVFGHVRTRRYSVLSHPTRPYRFGIFDGFVVVLVDLPTVGTSVLMDGLSHPLESVPRGPDTSQRHIKSYLAHLLRAWGFCVMRPAVVSSDVAHVHFTMSTVIRFHLQFVHTCVQTNSVEVVIRATALLLSLSVWDAASLLCLPYLAEAVAGTVVHLTERGPQHAAAAFHVVALFERVVNVLTLPRVDDAVVSLRAVDPARGGKACGRLLLGCVHCARAKSSHLGRAKSISLTDGANQSKQVDASPQANGESAGFVLEPGKHAPVRRVVGNSALGSRTSTAGAEREQGTGHPAPSPHVADPVPIWRGASRILIATEDTPRASTHDPPAGTGAAFDKRVVARGFTPAEEHGGAGRDAGGLAGATGGEVGDRERSVSGLRPPAPHSQLAAPLLTVTGSPFAESPTFREDSTLPLLKRWVHGEFGRGRHFTVSNLWALIGQSLMASSSVTPEHLMSLPAHAKLSIMLGHADGRTNISSRGTRVSRSLTSSLDSSMGSGANQTTGRVPMGASGRFAFAGEVRLLSRTSSPDSAEAKQTRDMLKGHSAYIKGNPEAALKYYLRSGTETAVAAAVSLLLESHDIIRAVDLVQSVASVAYPHADVTALSSSSGSSTIRGTARQASGALPEGRLSGSVGLASETLATFLANFALRRPLVVRMASTWGSKSVRSICVSRAPIEEALILEVERHLVTSFGPKGSGSVSSPAASGSSPGSPSSPYFLRSLVEDQGTGVEDEAESVADRSTGTDSQGSVVVGSIMWLLRMAVRSFLWSGHPAKARNMLLRFPSWAKAVDVAVAYSSDLGADLPSLLVHRAIDTTLAKANGPVEELAGVDDIKQQSTAVETAASIIKYGTSKGIGLAAARVKVLDEFARRFEKCLPPLLVPDQSIHEDWFSKPGDSSPSARSRKIADVIVSSFATVMASVVRDARRYGLKEISSNGGMTRFLAQGLENMSGNGTPRTPPTSAPASDDSRKGFLNAVKALRLADVAAAAQRVVKLMYLLRCADCAKVSLKQLYQSMKRSPVHFLPKSANQDEETNQPSRVGIGSSFSDVVYWLLRVTAISEETKMPQMVVARVHNSVVASFGEIPVSIGMASLLTVYFRLGPAQHVRSIVDRLVACLRRQFPTLAQDCLAAERVRGGEGANRLSPMQRVVSNEEYTNFVEQHVAPTVLNLHVFARPTSSPMVLTPPSVADVSPRTPKRKDKPSLHVNVPAAHSRVGELSGESCVLISGPLARAHGGTQESQTAMRGPNRERTGGSSSMGTSLAATDSGVAEASLGLSLAHCPEGDPTISQSSLSSSESRTFESQPLATEPLERSVQDSSGSMSHPAALFNGRDLFSSTADPAISITTTTFVPSRPCRFHDVAGSAEDPAVTSSDPSDSELADDSSATTIEESRLRVSSNIGAHAAVSDPTRIMRDPVSDMPPVATLTHPVKKTTTRARSLSAYKAMTSERRGGLATQRAAEGRQSQVSDSLLQAQRQKPEGSRSTFLAQSSTEPVLQVPGTRGLLPHSSIHPTTEARHVAVHEYLRKARAHHGSRPDPRSAAYESSDSEGERAPVAVEGGLMSGSLSSASHRVRSRHVQLKQTRRSVTSSGRGTTMATASSAAATATVTAGAKVGGLAGSVTTPAVDSSRIIATHAHRRPSYSKSTSAAGRTLQPTTTRVTSFTAHHSKPRAAHRPTAPSYSQDLLTHRSESYDQPSAPPPSPAAAGGHSRIQAAPMHAAARGGGIGGDDDDMIVSYVSPFVESRQRPSSSRQSSLDGT
eukprot:Rmarinus@m.3884